MEIKAHTRPVHGVRWRNFRRLLADKKLTITAAAEALKKPQGQVSHFGGKTPTKVIGDQIAGEIEATWGLPHGALDMNDSEIESTTKLGKPELQSQLAQLDPLTLREAYLLAVQEAGLELGIAHKYRLEDDPERTTRAYTFLAAGRAASEVAEYMAATMRRAQPKGVDDGGRVQRGGSKRR